MTGDLIRVAQLEMLEKAPALLTAGFAMLFWFVGWFMRGRWEKHVEDRAIAKEAADLAADTTASLRAQVAYWRQRAELTEDELATERRARMAADAIRRGA